MPFNTAAALEKIKSRNPEPAIPAIPAIREENQQDEFANRLLIGCYSENPVPETPEIASDGAGNDAHVEPASTPPLPLVGQSVPPDPGGHTANIRRNPSHIRSNVIPFRPHIDSIEPQPGDTEVYAAALRVHGPCGYGGIAMAIGWAAGRASAAETELRQAGRIRYDKTGRGTLIEQEGRADAE